MMHTDYTPGARRFTARTEDGSATYSVVACRPLEALGGEFILYTNYETNEDGLLEVRAGKAVGTAGDLHDMVTSEEWMVIDGLVMELQEQGMAICLRTDDLEYFQVRARRYGYDTAEQWLLEAIFGDQSGIERKNEEDQPND